MLQYMPEYLVFDFRAMYEYFQSEGFKGSADTGARQTKLLGHAPHSFDAFAAETAAPWRG